MFDKRLEGLAQVLIEHSLSIKKNDLFLISGSTLASPLINEVFKKALEKGANPYIRLGLEELSETFYKKASKNQLEYLSPLDMHEMKNIDARLSIIGPQNTRFMTNSDPKKQKIRSKAMKPLHDLFLKRAAKKDLRWCVTMFPTNAAAQDAEMSLSEYEEFVFNASHVENKDPIAYWKKLGRNQDRLKNILETKKEIHILAKGTDLKLSVEKRKWINCFGKENFPDGEIFTGPVENSANGVISFSFPSIYGGRRVDDVKLYFEKGKVIKSEATSGESFLKTMINMDQGSKRLGEFAFGMNYGIEKYTKNTLFDEKIGGTIHLAIGSGYPETGSTNNSGLHWDMVCDMRKKAELYADDELIYKNGKFLI
jgi:aminopeptidase